MIPLKMFNSAQAYLCWLTYMASQRGAECLTGNLTDEVLELAGVYELQSAQPDYCAEMPLMGEPGIDVSVQYNARFFQKGNPLIHEKVMKQGEFFHEYVKMIEEAYPEEVYKFYLYLEADTASGNSEKVAMFLRFMGDKSIDLIEKILKKRGQEYYIESLKKMMDKAAPDMELLYVAFMDSREDSGLRVVFWSENPADCGKKIVAAAERLCGADFAKELEHHIFELENGKDDLFTYMLDVDIMPDGSLGNIYGVEMMMPPKFPSWQRRWMDTESYGQVTGKLLEWGIADERIHKVKDCVFTMEAPDSQQVPYWLYSRISHFKLRWKDGKLMPAKVYLHMLTGFSQLTINESMDYQ